MIYLITGTPGAGKTLNTIKYINEDDAFKGRPVYYFNIPSIQTENQKGKEVLRTDWQEIEEEQVKRWFDLPSGSVVILDECQDIFPVAVRKGTAAPEHISRLAKHRHQGIDIVIITQEPRNIDSFVRRLVGQHHHYVRHFGAPMSKRLVWQRCCEDVNDYHQKLESQVQQVKFDKKYYGVYHSADEHTHKTRLPWGKLSLVILPIFILFGSIAYVVNHFTGEDETASQVVASQGRDSNNFSPASGFPRAEPMTEEQWLKQRKPRVAGLPHTAPIYDSLQEPQDYPRLICGLMAEKQECRCITQQGNKVQGISYQTCANIVHNGYFDAAKDPDGNRQERGGSRDQAPAPATSPRSTSRPSPSRFQTISQGDWLITSPGAPN